MHVFGRGEHERSLPDWRIYVNCLIERVVDLAISFQKKLDDMRLPCSPCQPIVRGRAWTGAGHPGAGV